jgi:hypothetical protein
MSLNAHQEDYCRYLGTLAPEDKCWCGWYRKEECGPWCHRRTNGLTCADKLAQACSECTAYPSDPGSKVYHRRDCSRYEQ